MNAATDRAKGGVGTPKAGKPVNTSLDESRLLLGEMDVMLSRVRVLMQSPLKAKASQKP